MRKKLVAIQDTNRGQRDYRHAHSNPCPYSLAPGLNGRKTHRYSRPFALPFLQIAQQLHGILVAQAWIALQTFAHNVAERAWNRLIVIGDRQRAFLSALDQAGDDALSLERSFAGQ